MVAYGHDVFVILQSQVEFPPFSGFMGGYPFAEARFTPDVLKSQARLIIAEGKKKVIALFGKDIRLEFIRYATLFFDNKAGIPDDVTELL